MSKSENKDKFVKNKKIEIDNYIRALKSLLVLRKMIMEKLSGEFYFTSKLNYKNLKDKDPQTPDYIVKLNNGIWIGEIKKSLANPDIFGTEKEYIEKYIEGKLIAQLKKYDEPFKEFEVDSHDVVLMVPHRDVEALGFLKVKYLDKKQNLFKNNFAVIVYSIEAGSNRTEFIIINLEWGKVKNKIAHEILSMGYKKMIGEIKEDIAKYKIYEESDKTPIEYVMSILWTDIFPEIINKSDVNKIIEWRNKKEHVFEVKLDDLVEYLQKMYTLPSLNENDRKQFTSSIVLSAMEKFSKINFKNQRTNKMESAVTKISKQNGIYFSVIYKNFPEKDELKYLLKSLYLEQEEKDTSINQVVQTSPPQSSLTDFK